jgi:hypothetical protein
MSTTPNGLTSLSADTGTPSWITNLVTFLLVAVPVALSVWKPNGSFTSANTQAVIVGLGVLAAGLVHLVKLLSENGLKKAGIAKTITEEESWVKANFADLTGTFTAAKAAVATIPGLPAHLAQVDTAVADVKGRLDAIPPTDAAALKALALTGFSEFLDGAQLSTSGGFVTVPKVAISTPGSVPVAAVGISTVPVSP